MRSPARSSLLALALVLGTAGPAVADPRGLTAGAAVSRLAEGLRFIERVLHIQQQPGQVQSHTVSLGAHDALLELDQASGASRVVELKSGNLYIDEHIVGRYAVGGPLDRSWRRLLADASSLDTPQLLAAVRAWTVDGLAGEDLAAKERIDAALDALKAEATVAPPPLAAAGGAPAPAAGVAPHAPVTAPSVPAAAPAAPVSAAPSAIQTLYGGVRNVVAMFVALAMMGVGTVFFARRYLEVIADTASESFGRSLVVGLLGQLLLFPTLAMLIVGLIFTIVGILLLPFAIIAFVVAACAAALGGYLAVAHAIGETVTRRRMANGAFVRSPNAYGYLFTGLVGLLGPWAAVALFSWAGPVVYVLSAAAFVATWLAATVGFGAVLLSRAGLRDAFTGRHLGDQSGEYLWATPPATPAAPRSAHRE